MSEAWVRLPADPDEPVTLKPYVDFRDPDGPHLFEPTWRDVIEEGWAYADS